MREMNQNNQSKSLDQTETIPEINWSLSELEGIVYDFITFNPKNMKEAEETRFKPSDVKKEDLMKIQKLDKKRVEEQPLPQMIREYILHDRGNSIFLGDSVANLPSPVAEGQTIKNLFKFNEDDDEKKLERERDKDKDKNEIKIEGKPDKSKGGKDKSASVPGDKKDLNMRDIEEIDKIVFEETVIKLTNQPKHPVKSGQSSKHQSLQ